MWSLFPFHSSAMILFLQGWKEVNAGNVVAWKSSKPGKELEGGGKRRWGNKPSRKPQVFLWAAQHLSHSGQVFPLPAPPSLMALPVQPASSSELPAELKGKQCCVGCSCHSIQSMILLQDHHLSLLFVSWQIAGPINFHWQCEEER